MYISVVTLPVDDLDRAIEFYTKKLGWEKTMDAPMGEGSRWVTVAPSGAQTAFTLSTRGGEFSHAERPDKMTGVVIEVDDVMKMQDTLKNAGIEVVEPARMEPWGGWVTFKDSEGNVHGMHSNPTE